MPLQVPDFLRKGIKQIPGAPSLLKIYRREQNRHTRQKLAAIALPSVVAIELTNNCNLRCTKCPLVKTTRARGFIDDALFDKILKDIESAGAPTEIALSGSGEPTLHPRLVDYVKAARGIPNIGVIGFATNGIALNPDLSEKLLDAGLTRLKASLDMDDPDTYRRLNGKDCYEQVVGNFLHFCDINRNSDNRCRVTLKATLYNNDLALALRLKEKWERCVDEVRVTPVHNWAGTRGATMDSKPEKKKPCSLLWQQVQILWDGQITLCCMDTMEGHFNMGNIRHKNFSKYWLGDPGLKRIRSLHEKIDLSTLPVCAGCDMSDYHDINV